MDETNQQKVISYYDAFANEQLKTGINVRHRTIFHLLKKAGLRRQDQVLEIGCGVGTLTYLIGKYCSSGKVLATDISPKSIEWAKARTKKFAHVHYMVTDMRDFSSPEKFDFIVLPDVLEHIPLQEHAALFATISRHCHAHSVIAINIPDPYLLQWYHRHEPGKLQIIDQPLYTNIFLPAVYANGFFLAHLQRYALHTIEPDYQWLLLKPQLEWTTLHPKSKWRQKWQSLRARIYF